MNYREMSRRQFAVLAGTTLLAPALGTQTNALTARQVIERIKNNMGMPWQDRIARKGRATVDTFKAGNPDTQVSGIATSFMSTLYVLQRSAASNKNLIITHEPTFWNHLDKSDGLTDDPLYLHKMDFIKKHDLVVWRFHDHWHARRPDGIFEGWSRELGWDKYIDKQDERLFVLPETVTLAEVVQEVKRNLKSDSIRVIGDPQLKVRKVRRGSHTLEGNIAAVLHADVLLVTEARERFSIEWMRDTVLSGQKKAMILLAHQKGEESGMDNCATWLRTFISEVPVEFISSGEPFWRPAQADRT